MWFTNPANICWSSRRLQDVFKTRLQRNKFSSSNTFWRHLANASWRRLEDVLRYLAKRLKDVLKTSSRCLKDVLEDKISYAENVLQILLEDTSQAALKTSWKTKNSSRRLEDVLKVNKMFTGDICIWAWPTNKSKSVSNKSISHKSIFHQSKVNTKCNNYNQIISIFVLFWNSISRISSKSILQNRRGNNLLQVTYYGNVMNDCLYSHIYLIYIWKIYLH